MEWEGGSGLNGGNGDVCDPGRNNGNGDDCGPGRDGGLR
jgi:hypothetical protein